jgi:hypothetical protein
LGKMFSGIVVGRLRDWLLNHEVLPTFQAGFVRDKRTSDNLFIIKTIVNNIWGKRRPNILVLCGLQKSPRFNW